MSREIMPWSGINIQDSICTFGSFFSINEPSTITRSGNLDYVKSTST
jgi:hypothetical protein